MTRIAWFDTSSGASGDMFLGALIGAGAPVDVLQAAIDAVSPEPVRLVVEQVRRNGFAATRCHVEVTDSVTHRDWATIRGLIEGADLDPEVRRLSLLVFEKLARAEARAHGIDATDVHFHEVGALDSIADVVGAAAGFVHLGLVDRARTSTIALGGGFVQAAHGRMAVPVPAVVELLLDRDTSGGPVDLELTTPTGAAILATLVIGTSSQQPSIRVEQIGVGAGGRDPDGHTNVLRLLLGERASGSYATGGARVIETNVDDLDPRLWPDVIAALLEAGAADAWLTPIVMKKGRPAHTLHVLVAETVADDVRREIFRQTSTIGVRETAYEKFALAREFISVDVAGHPVAVKLARLDGELMNVQPEYEDVAAAARALGRPVKDVLAEANALAREVTT